ncbi:MAG TPA: PhzF family phenazine biosynthesis protein [Solirubrobacteraceae bacterium]|nr:PhzF family phenazine biosynthesis protein [Solirubrobacteraceae bacterium]
MDTRRYVIADVFTDAPLEGNQLAVFTDGQGLSDETMQRVARELNLSETVFVLPAPGDTHATIRIFTPFTELPFAGHPVLGTAFVLGGLIPAPQIRLQTGSGLVPIALTREGAQVTFGEMEQPIPAVEPFSREDELLAALGVERSELPLEMYRNGPRFVYVTLAGEAAVAELTPDLRALSRFDGVGVLCSAGSGTRYKARMFAPGLGVSEDPATGSAAGPLAVHLARHGRIAFGQQIEISQGAEIQRPSLLYARVDGAPERIDRVAVGGCAVVVARGEYRVA